MMRAAVLAVLLVPAAVIGLDTPLVMADNHLTDGAFVTIWGVDADKTIKIPVGDQTGNYTVNWGDGTNSTHVSDATYVYTTTGNYTVSISGDFKQIFLNGVQSSSTAEVKNAKQLLSIEQWGDMKWSNMTSAFRGASNMTYSATDTPDLLNVKSMEYMFNAARAFNGDLSSWNVSAVTNMDSMFSGASPFNGDISRWNVSAVTNMNRMFSGASSFNGNISGWNVSAVTNMDSMFSGASSFNGNISSWNVSAVTNMNSMFDGADAFDQNLGNWYVVPADTAYDTSEGTLNVTTISAQNMHLDGHSLSYGIGSDGNSNLFNITDSNTLMFKSTPPADTYNVNVTASGSDVFESDNNWRMLNITVSGSGNTAPIVNAGTNQTVGEGDTVTLSGSATDPDAGDTVESYLWSAPPGSGITFVDDSSDTTTFIAPDVTSDTTFIITLTARDGSDSGAGHIVVTVKETSGAFILTWETTSADETVTVATEGEYTVIWGDGQSSEIDSTVLTHTYAFPGTYTVSMYAGLERIQFALGNAATNLKSLEQWGDIEWSSMENAFRGASNMVYNAGDVPNLFGVRNTGDMFRDATTFDGDLSGWDVSKVTDMSFMFDGASDFNGDISGWDVSAVTNMNRMFSGASPFNGNISGWDVSAVTNMDRMFSGASSFNGNISGWDVSAVTNMDRMFSGASPFNGNISGWDVSAVTNMNRMFSGTSFNQTLNGWNVSAVTDMNSMFSQASKFNQPLNNWNVSAVTNMNSMFAGAFSFNGNISSWNVSAVTDMFSMFVASSSFNGDLSGWDVSAVTNMNSMFDFATSFDQNLGNWYVTLDPDTIAGTGIPGVVGTISAQNQPLRDHVPMYDIVGGLDKNHFEIVSENWLNMTSDDSGTIEYSINVTASGTTNVFESGNNWRILNITVTGSANQPPTVTDITGADAVNEGDSGTLTGTATDGDGTISSYLWSVNNTSAVMITTENAAILQYTASQVNSNTAVTFTLTVTDGDGATGSDTYEVTINNVVANIPPTVTGITGDDAINEGASGMLTGTATDDDGIISSYLWSVNNTSAVMITTENAAILQYTASQVNSNTAVTFTLTVTDGDGATGSDTYEVTINNVVANIPPTVTGITGDDAVNEGASGTLTGTATDGDGTISSYLWSVNNTSAVMITTEDAAILQYTASQVNSNTAVTFTLTVTDGDGATGSDTYEVTINNVVANIPPTVTGITGDDAVNEGASGMLTGTATDDDGIISSYLWSVNNTSAVMITTEDAAILQYTASQVNSNTAVTFTLTVTDGDGATGSDTYEVTINNVVANIPPTVTGITGDDAINEGASGMLTGTATDDDGIISSYLWSVNNTSAVMITTEDAAILQYTALQVDSNTPVTFTLTVTDNNGATASDTYDVAINNLTQNILIDDASGKSTSSSKTPAVHINALAQSRLVDIPPHIAEQVESHDASDPLEPITPDGTFDFPLVINGYGYLLDDTTNTLVPQIVTVGDDDPTIITFTVYTQKDLAHFTLYLNLQGENTNYANSDTYITYKDDGTTSITDPHGYIDNATITVTQEDDSVPERKTVRITVEFGEEPMGPTNMVAYMWNTDRKAAFVKIIDAFEVAAALLEPVMQAADPEPLEPDSGLPADPESVAPGFEDDAVDPEYTSSDTPWPDDYDDAQVLTLIRMWSGFESEFITDTQLLELLGLEDYQDVDLPDWMMTELGVLVAKGDVTVGEFVLALQYMLTHA